MRVLISGAGVGGLALSGFLKDSGIECVLIDKAGEWGGEGFSIGIWSSGRRMLAKLGIGERFDAEAIPFKKIRIKNGAGRLIREFDLSAFDVELGASLLHVPRGKLHEWLLAAAGFPVRMGSSVDSLSEGKDEVRVTYAGGAQEAFDVVVGADGVHSAIRRLTSQTPEIYLNWRAWWTWADADAAPAHIITEYAEAREFIVLSREGGRTLAVLMAPADHAVWDTEEGRVRRLSETFRKETGAMPKLLERHADADVMPSDLMTVETPRWRTTRTVLIGDAAHALAPFTAFGATLALEDAYVLAGELIKAKDDGDVSGALKRYERKRRPRIARAHALTRRMRMTSAVSSALWRKTVNLLMPLLPGDFEMRDYLAFMREEL